MTFLLANWKIIAALALVVMLLLGAYQHGVSTTADKYELQITAKELADAEARETARIKNEASITKLQGEKHASQKRIDDLAADNKRLRVLLPGCRLVVSKPNPTDPAIGGTQTPPGGEPLPEPAETAQGALDTFMESSDADAHTADSVVSECRVVYEWAKGLNK